MTFTKLAGYLALIGLLSIQSATTLAAEDTERLDEYRCGRILLPKISRPYAATTIGVSAGTALAVRIGTLALARVTI